MLGPVFNREAIVLPKRTSTFTARGVYLLSLFLLMCTGYLVLDGSRSLAATSDAAKFGRWMFTLLSPLQLVVLSALASVGATSSVAQEKDRRTLILLLLTRLTGFELVAGKAAATLLSPLSLLLVALPLFLTLPLLGGVAPEQVLAVFAVTLVSVMGAATVGTIIALWREKTFQSIALTVLALLFLVGIGEIAMTLTGSSSRVAAWIIAISPPRALTAATTWSLSDSQSVMGVVAYCIVGTAASIGLIGWGVARVRIWNPSREVRLKSNEPETSEEISEIAAASAATDIGSSATHSPHSVPTPSSWKVRAPRPVWNNPILWREIRTWAYGRKVLLIRGVFALIFMIIAAAIYGQIQTGVAMETAGRIGRVIPAVTVPMAVLGVVSLVLTNALAVNAITGERDGLALDLLLVTDLRPSEFVFGKWIGVLYVAKEMILLPMLLIIYLGVANVMTYENMTYALIGFINLILFVTMLGIHSGMNYVAGRTATLASLGTVFFLCVGIAICIRQNTT
ncbi:MAG: ABC transporter permease subunit [Planctomycetota bacterium]